MNVEIGTEVAQFPEKEYINGIFVAVRPHLWLYNNQPHPKKNILEDCQKK
jgi:hypothetical protein